MSIRMGRSDVGSTEFCQTLIMERNLSSHQIAGNLETSDSTPLLRRNGSSIPSILEYDTMEEGNNTSVPGTHTIRLQVILWYIGKVDVVEGRVPVTFRATMYWNALESEFDTENETASASTRTTSTWLMHGRQKAYVQEARDAPSHSVEVPPLSILNVVTFDTIGNPDVSLLNENTRLMRWTCMYRATLIQDHWKVHNFPHDHHEISLRLAVLAHRQPQSRWDRSVWKLALATQEDCMGCIRDPRGLVVESVSIPGFEFNKEEGLQFSFQDLNHGPGEVDAQDTCLHVQLRVLRQSAYYDRNIMPLLGFLNFVAISITALEARNFFERGLLTLNIAFVEIGMRMTADSHLPSAAYQIKMQRILNEYFYGLLVLVLESLVVYELDDFGIQGTGIVDAIAALLVFTHNAYTLVTYYADARNVRKQLLPTNCPTKEEMNK